MAYFDHNVTVRAMPTFGHMMDKEKRVWTISVNHPTEQPSVNNVICRFQVEANY